MNLSWKRFLEPWRDDAQTDADDPFRIAGMLLIKAQPLLA